MPQYSGQTLSDASYVDVALFVAFKKFNKIIQQFQRTPRTYEHTAVALHSIDHKGRVIMIVRSSLPIVLTTLTFAIAATTR